MSQNELTNHTTMADKNLLEGKKRAPENWGRVLVLGLGKSGKAAMEYLMPLIGARVEGLYLAAGARNPQSEDYAQKAQAAGVVVSFGDGAVSELSQAAHEAASSQSEAAFGLCVASPGISEHTELYQAALRESELLLSEVEFAWRESDADSVWVAITGTNGKTTTTSCVEHILKASGMAARAVGNIGDPCISAVGDGDAKVYVAEVSSYQLASTTAFAPNVALLLNITPDHLHWHHTLEAYRDAKYKILDNLASVEGAVAVLDAANDVVRGKVRELKAMTPEERGFSYIPMGTKAGLHGDMRAACGAENAAFLGEDDMLTIAFGGEEYAVCRAEELLIPGAHNASNALASAAAALAVGVSAEEIASALKCFQPLEHRIEPCGCVAGAACYNDSKATNVDATLVAVGAFPGKKLHILLGGDDKGTDLEPLVAACIDSASTVVCYGEARERFAEAFYQAKEAGRTGELVILEASGMTQALDAALEVSGEGDVVLLSPACASFDEFSCFEERGEVFKKLVAERAASIR